MHRQSPFVIVAACLMLGGVAFGQSTGSLVVNVLDYETDFKLKDKVRKKLDDGFLRWAVVGDELVIPLVSEKFLEPEFPNTTRWGERDKISVPAGHYRLTCIGYEQKELSSDPQEVLAEGAYFNLDVLEFDVHPDRTTRLDVLPTYYVDRGLFLVKWFLLRLKVGIYEEDRLVAEKVISERSETSIRWDEYSGPLKRAP